MTTARPTLAARPGQAGIDPRSPRFGAAITAVLLLVVIGLSLSRGFGVTVTERIAEPGFILFVVITGLFGWGAFAGVRRHPYGALYRVLLGRRLAPPAEREDPRPPTFAQGVGFAITLVGLTLQVAGLPYALVVAASFAFVAAFLNSVFAYCLGCQIYLLIVRARAARGAAA